jgi:hypothetical protein
MRYWRVGICPHRTLAIENVFRSGMTDANAER